MFMFEATGDLNHSLGVLLSVIISVGISKRWGLSIFDSIQKIRGLPFMPDLQEQFYELKARDVMERDVPCLNLKASIEDINQLLEKYISNSKYGTQDYSIPIIETPDNKIVVGATNVNALIELVEVLEYEIVRQKQVHDLTMSGIINVAQRKKEQQKYLQKLRSRKYDLRNRLGAILLKAPIVFDPDTPVEQVCPCLLSRIMFSFMFCS
jgi:CBS domain-containing protein